MDYQNQNSDQNPYQNNNYNQNPYQNSYMNPQQNNPKRSAGMELAAFVFGIIALSTFCCIYTAIIGGALGILFALLSRGGEMKLTGKAKIGLILSIVAMCASAALYGFSFYTAIQYYGSYDNMLRSFCDMYGFDYEALFGAATLFLM